MSQRPAEEHAQNWDLRHEDFNDVDFLYDVYDVMRRRAPFVHTDTPFLTTMPDSAWVAVRYSECTRILQDWEHFSSNPTPDAAEAFGGDLVITLDPPRQQFPELPFLHGPPQGAQPVLLSGADEGATTPDPRRDRPADRRFDHHRAR